jgi:hypothetical protein
VEEVIKEDIEENEVEEEFLAGVERCEEINFRREYRNAKAFYKHFSDLNVIEKLGRDEDEKSNVVGTPEMPTQTPSEAKVFKVDKKTKSKKPNKKPNKRPTRTRSVKPKKELKSSRTSKSNR